MEVSGALVGVSNGFVGVSGAMVGVPDGFVGVSCGLVGVSGAFVGVSGILGGAGVFSVMGDFVLILLVSCEYGVCCGLGVSAGFGVPFVSSIPFVGINITVCVTSAFSDVLPASTYSFAFVLGVG